MIWPRDVHALLRGTAVGSVSGMAGIAGHGVGGGGFAPAESTTVLTVLACVAVGYLAAALPARWGRAGPLAATLTAGQIISHFTLMTDGGHHHVTQHRLAMLLAHASAIAVTALLIRGAELTLRVLVSRLSLWFPIRFAPCVIDFRPGCVAAAPPAPATQWLLAATTISRRGPPVHG